MAASPIPVFDDATVAEVAKAIGELYSGAELTRVFAAAGLKDVDGEGVTKWKRLYNAVAAHQNQYGNGKATIALIHSAMSPSRTHARMAPARVAQDGLNQVLSLSGLAVGDDGRVHRTKRATTDAEAHARATRLRARLENRGVHFLVLAGIRDDWMRADYYEAVFESVKHLGERLRQMTGLDLDGHKLVDRALTGQSPLIRINGYRTVTERNEQLGVASLARGLFSAMRNPQAHEPKATWTMTEQDALDVLGTLSLVHRRLDAAASCCERSTPPAPDR